jgi:hypothetical protein
VPTALQREGDFSELLALGSQYQIYNPFSIRPAANGRFSREPFRCDAAGNPLTPLANGRNRRAAQRATSFPSSCSARSG